MTYSFTDRLPDHVTCSCGDVGAHPSGRDCPHEGEALFEAIDFDPMLLKIRYDADPVIMALIGHAEHLLWTARAGRVVLVHQSQTMEDQRAEHRKAQEGIHALEQTWAKQVDDANRKVFVLERQLQDAKVAQERAGKLSADAKRRIEDVIKKEAGWRAIIEDLAIRTGYFQDGSSPYGWSPEELLRKETLSRMTGLPKPAGESDG